jgi:WD40 repeat protein
MNIFHHSRLILILLTLLTACTQQLPQPTAQIPTMPAITPIQDTKITPENIEQLAQIKQLSNGMAPGDPFYLPDGTHLIQATRNGVYVFDITSYPGGRLLIPDESYYYGEGLALSPNGETYAIGNHLFATKDGQKLEDLELSPDHGEWRLSGEIIFSPDGLLIARSYQNIKTGDKWRVGVWRLKDGRLLHNFEASSGYSASFSREGRFITLQFSEKNKSYIHLYDLQHGELLSSWPAERATFLPENRLAVESDETIRIFDLETGKSKHAFFGKLASFSADGQLIVFLAFDELKVYRIADEQLISVLKGSFKDYDYALIRFSADGQTLAGFMGKTICCGGYASSLSLWRLSDGTLIRKMDRPSYQFNFSPSGDTLAITYPLSSTQILRTSDGSLMTNLGGYTYLVNQLAFTPNSQELVVSVAAEDNIAHRISFPGDYQAPLLFYEIPTGNLYKYQAETFRNVPIALSTDGKIYKPDELRDLPGISEIDANISSIAFSSDHKKIAIGYARELYVWDIPTKTLLIKVIACENERGFVNSLGFSPDGLFLAHTCINQAGQSYSGTQTVQIWETLHGNPVKNLEAEHELNMLVFSADGKYIAAGGPRVSIWDPSNGALLFTINQSIFVTPDEGVYGIQRLAFSADGRILALGLRDGTVELWDVERQEKIHSLSHFTHVTNHIYDGVNSVHDLDFSADGSLLAVGLDDGEVLLYGIK